VPLYRAISSRASIELLVAYGDRYGVDPRSSAWMEKDFTWAGDMLGGYRSVFMPNWGSKNPSTFFGKVNPSLLSVIRGFKPDAMVVMGYYGLYQLQGFGAARLLDIPLLYTSDTNVSAERAGLRTDLKRAVVGQLYKGVSGFLVSGVRNREHYESYGVDLTRQFDFSWAVDNAALRRRAQELAPRRETLRAEFGVPAGRVCVLFSGRLSAEKGVDCLIRALSELPEMHLCVAGDGAERAKLESLASNQLRGRCSFLGFLNQDRLPEAYAAADLLSLPSSFEPWGLVCNEAMKFGLPIVVSSEVGAAADLVVEGVTGWTHAARDVSALKQALWRAHAEIQRSAEGLHGSVLSHIDGYSIERQVHGLSSALDRT